jgi:PAS domain S-box-containing protein
MATYPFVDIAVLEPVRRSFAAGDALVLATPDLSAINWANGAGLELFGLGSLGEALTGEAVLDDIQRRQIAAAIPADDGERVIHLRFVQAPQTILLPVHLKRVVLPDGAQGLLIRIPAHALQSRNVTLSTLDAIEAEGFHAALIKTGARIVERSARFENVTVDPDDLARMIHDASAEKDRLVKRQLRTSKGVLPAALARLTDEDGLHLLVVLDPDDEEPAGVPGEGVEYADVLADVLADGGGASGTASIADDETEAMVALPEADVAHPLLPDGEEATEVAAPHHASEPNTEPAAEPSADALLSAVPGMEPLRFAWKTDGNGILTELSPRFAEALGTSPDTILGRDFTALGEVFGVHGVKDIAAALARTDTWSGRELLWPHDGLAVPVELAALPMFDRERRFCGFRGFGVARFDTPRALPDAPLANAPAQPAAENASPPAFGRRAAMEATAPAVVSAGGGNGAVQRPGLGPEEASAFAEIREHLRAATASGGDDGNGLEPVAADAVSPQPLAAPDGDAEAAASPAIADSREQAGQANLVSKLPLPVLIYSADGLLFANDLFLALSGHANLASLAEAGGLDALFDSGGMDGDGKEARGMQLRRADGSVLDINAHLQSVPWNGGKALMLAIAERKPVPASRTADADGPFEDLIADSPPDDMAAQAARRQIEELTAILDTATDGVVVLESDGRIRSLNNAAEALFGYEEEEVAGQHFNTLLAIESHRAARDYLNALTDNGVASVLNDGREMIGREREGRFVPLFVTIGRLAASDGYCAVIRDMTNFKRAEEELTAARRDAESASSNKSEFVARISHEIRTPLNAIIGFSELMMQERFGALGNERYKNYAEDIHSSGTLVLQLVNDLLDISRIEAGEQTLDFRAVDLNGIVGDALALLQPQASRERVLLRTSLAETLPRLVADERSIKQIILNLVSNAIRFTDAGGQVIVSTAMENDGTISLRVRDTGIGMNDNELANAMKPYRQVGRKPQSESGGTGLGLPLARALAESNKADFRIRSTPGHGTVIEIAFPASRVLAG